MSDLESEAKPVLEPMIAGRALTLSQSDQATLARWALKTTTACDLATGDAATPAELRGLLPTADRVPDGIVVLLARYSGRRFPLHSGRWSKRVRFDIGGVETEQPVLMLTVAIGSVVVQVLAHGLDGVVDLHPVNEKQDYTRAIWPVETDRYWPLPVALGDDGLHRFTGDL